MWEEVVEGQGFVVTPPLLTSSEIETLATALTQPSVYRSRAGIRHALGLDEVASLARDPRLLSIAGEILGVGAFPYHATLFDKSPTSNWLVVWHQDTALPLRERQELMTRPNVTDRCAFFHEVTRVVFCATRKSNA